LRSKKEKRIDKSENEETRKSDRNEAAEEPYKNILDKNILKDEKERKKNLRMAVYNGRAKRGERNIYIRVEPIGK